MHGLSLAYHYKATLRCCTHTTPKQLCKNQHRTHATNKRPLLAFIQRSKVSDKSSIQAIVWSMVTSMAFILSAIQPQYHQQQTQELYNNKMTVQQVRTYVTWTRGSSQWQRVAETIISNIPAGSAPARTTQPQHSNRAETMQKGSN